MKREEAVLHELNLYPLWKRRGQAAPALSRAVAHPSDGAASHSTRPSKDDSQVAGYPAYGTAEGSLRSSGAPTGAPLAGVGAGGEGEVDVPIRKSREQVISELGWPELKAMVRDCTACRLRAGCTQTVFGVGDEKANWLFVGEGPGADEDARGEPFVGQAGKLLDNMLAAIKLKRGNNVYIDNIVKCRPPGNRTPAADEIATCLPYLQRQIELIQPKLIVALGKTAATALLGRDAALGSLRGKLYDYRSIPLLVTYHPSYLLRTPMDKEKAWQDLCLAVETMKELQQ